MTERISVNGSRGNGEYERRQRRYREEEVREALERVGLSTVGVFASPDGARFESTSPPMWIVAQGRPNIERSLAVGNFLTYFGAHEGTIVGRWSCSSANWAIVCPLRLPVVFSIGRSAARGLGARLR
jgi:hypothetical protein